MIRTITIAVGTWIVVATSLSAPAAAAPDDQTVRLHEGKIRCLLSTDDVPRGGGPTAVCDVVDGDFGIAPMSTAKYPQRLNLAVTLRDGELFWMAGELPPVGGDVVLGSGETYRANGWTVRNDEFKSTIVNDYSGHGISVNPVEVRAVWP